MIGIVDYGLGNIHSLQNALSFLGAKSVLENDANKICSYDKLILPGVGAFGDAMNRLKSSKMDIAIKEFVNSNKALLGVCLGLHLLFEKGYEFGEHKGLGILNGEVVHFDKNKFKIPHKIPHMGWNTCKFVKQSKLIKNLKQEEYFYFVHSYHILCDKNIVLCDTQYGYTFASGIEYKNIFGLQPHPEKSHNVGLKILKNFMEL